MNNTLDQTTSAFPSSTVLRRQRRFVFVVSGLALTSSLVACTAQQRRALGEEDLRDSLRSRIQLVSGAHSLKLEAATCSANIDAVTSRVNASCSADTESGETVVATFVGVADINDETCRADFTVEIDSVVVVDQTEVSCFASV